MNTPNKAIPTRSVISRHSSCKPALTLPNFAAKDRKTPSYVAPIECNPATPIARRTPATAIINGIIPDIASPMSPSVNTIRQPPVTQPFGLLTVKDMDHDSLNEKSYPSSPLYIPKIGMVKTPSVTSPTYRVVPTTPSQLLAPGENPWLPPKVDGSSDIKIAAITPIGTIAMVPTCDKRAPVTPRRLPPTPNRHLTLRVVDENTGETKIDPLLTTTIYLDCTRPEDQDYNHVAQHMRDITVTTTTLQKQYSNTLRLLTNVTGRVSQRIFDDALSIYENNQVYYQDLIDDKTVDIQVIRDGLTTLEHWFASIIEPKATDDLAAWRERESLKLTKGITAYCDPELYQYIQPLPDNIRLQIRQYHIGLL